MHYTAGIPVHLTLKPLPEVRSKPGQLRAKNPKLACDDDCTLSARGSEPPLCHMEDTASSHMNIKQHKQAARAKFSSNAFLIFLFVYFSRVCGGTPCVREGQADETRTPPPQSPEVLTKTSR
jgi:hypothetical protein